jgi:cytochrome oxidase Cu insertion factor (SCO1/SenC/PrrC family)
MQTELIKQVSLDNQQRKGRLIFVLMAIFFVVPIIVVVMMYKFNWKPTGQSHGELVMPPRLIQQVETLKDSKGKVISKFWADKWNMVYVTDICEQICQDKLHIMRQLHVSLYKDIPRVQRILITSTQDVNKIKADYPDLIIFNQSVADIKKFSQQFDMDGDIATQSNRLYLVDPLGHIMMSYPVNTPAADIRKDLVRLLQYSWAG